MIRKNIQWRRRNSAAPAGAFGSSGRQKSQVGSSQALTGGPPTDRARGGAPLRSLPAAPGFRTRGATTLRFGVEKRKTTQAAFFFLFLMVLVS